MPFLIHYPCIVVLALTAASLSAQTEIFVNFGETPYDSDGVNAWNSFDLVDNDTDRKFIPLPATALVDAAGASSGVSLAVDSTRSGPMASNNGTDSVNWSGNPNAWFDPSVAEQRETFGITGGSDYNLVYTFSGFDPAATVDFGFVLGRTRTGDRAATITRVAAGDVLNDAQVDTDGSPPGPQYPSATGLTGSGSYTFTLVASGADWGCTANAIRVALTIPAPGVRASIIAPLDGGTVRASDPVTVEVHASAVGTSVDRVDLTVNGEFFGSDDTAPYTFDLGYVAEGALNLSATAYGIDASVDTNTAEVTVTSPLARAWARHSIDTGINGADGARTADVDGDGDMDLIVAFEEDATVRIYENPGIGTAINGNWSYASFTSGVLSSIEDANLADLDGDGRIDFVASMEGTNRNLVVFWAPAAPGDYWNNANWTAMTLPAAAGQDWMYSQVLDLDGQNGPDIVAGSKGNVAGSDPATVSWFKAPADPRVAADWIRYTMTTAGWIMSVEPQDMDGDGDTDIVISDRRSGGVQQAARWLENPGPGAPGLTSSWASHTIAGVGKEVMFLDLVDLDGDGLQDVIIPLLLGTATDQWLFARRLDASGTNWSVSTIDYPDGTKVPGGTGDGKATISVDINNDGQLDVVSSHGMAFSPIQGMVWGEHDGDPAAGTWTWQSISGPEGEKFDRIVAIDVDGDGDLDLISTDEDESLVENGLGVMLYENPRNDVVAVSSPAELWRLEWFGFSANSGVAADDVDFDQDGLVNVLERAFGSDPTTPSVAGILPELGTIPVSENDYLSLSYRRLVGGTGVTGIDYTAGGLTYTVEHNGDFADPWSTGSIMAVGVPTDLGSGIEAVTVRLTAPLPPEGRQFMRLQVTGL